MSNQPSYPADPKLLRGDNDKSTQLEDSATGALKSELNESPQKAKKLQIWFGDLSRSGFNTRYLELRDQLAESAFWGDFDMVSQVLMDVEETYGQSWVNAPRLSK